MTDMVEVPRLSTVQLISNARRALAEARDLPDFRRVMEAATVAADAAKRAAKLMEAQGVAAEVAKQANDAANDAAAVRIEAQAGAGRILREMQESGQRVGRNEGRSKESSGKLQLDDLGVEKTAAHRWQRVADVPEEKRADYVESTKADGGEITTAGLLRYAAQQAGEPEPNVHDDLNHAYDAVAKAMAVFAEFRNAGAIAAHAADSRRKTRFRELVARTRAWVEEAEQVLA